MWSPVRREVNAVNASSATSASEISRCSSSSQIAFGWWIGIHAASSIPEIAAWTAGLARVVIENRASRRREAAIRHERRTPSPLAR
jgi:hypothetical protein